MVMMPSCLITDDCARQELTKWQADRERWAETLPVMGFLSQFLTLFPVTEPHFGSASTDGKFLYFCPHYSATLTEEARLYLQAHLIWHCVAGHLTAPLVASRHRWHLACDHEVNALLLALGVALPVDAPLFPVCVGRNAMEVYRWLAGHPGTSLEVTADTHPAELWWHLPDTQPDERIAMLWRHRAQLIAKDSSGLPERVAKFCEAR